MRVWYGGQGGGGRVECESMEGVVAVTGDGMCSNSMLVFTASKGNDDTDQRLRSLEDSHGPAEVNTATRMPVDVLSAVELGIRRDTAVQMVHCAAEQEQLSRPARVFMIIM